MKKNKSEEAGTFKVLRVRKIENPRFHPQIWSDELEDGNSMPPPPSSPPPLASAEVVSRSPDPHQEDSISPSNQTSFKILGTRIAKNQQPWYNYNSKDICTEPPKEEISEEIEEVTSGLKKRKNRALGDCWISNLLIY